MRKNKGAEDDDQRTIKYHSNPFHIVALGDFRPASRDSKTTRHWEDINGGADLDFTATLQSEAAQTQSAEMLQRLLFFRPHFPKPRLINGLRPPGVSEEEDDPGEGIPPMAGSMHRGKNAEPGDGDDDEAPKKGEAGKPENGKTEPAEEKGPE